MRRAPDQLIIVDNTSGDSETEAIAKQFGALYLIESTPGLSRARNRGLIESESEIVAYLDDDAVPEESWLDTVRLPFADPNVGIVTGETVPSLPAPTARTAPARSLTNKDQQWFEIAAYGGLGIGTNMAFRKSQCSGWKVFDERMGRGAPLEGMEEHHAFVGLVSRGNKAVHLPDAVVVHSSQNSKDVTREARNSIAYWLILFSEYPGHRRELLRFVLRRLFHRPLEWDRSTPDPGEIVTSGWRSLFKAAVAGILLYLRCRKPKKP
jgi:glycosyltransferase involved in cell wall biosynthesis